MRFLADEDVYFATVAFLRREGHDALTSYEAGLNSLSDPVVLAYARENHRILVTRDSDYGGLIFLTGLPATGVIFLRVDPFTVDQVHRQIVLLLAEHSEEELHDLFVVIEPGRHRLRPLP